MSDHATIAVDQFLAHPPAKVWRALTDSDLLARWLMPNDFRPLPGHRFTFHTQPRPGQGFDGVVHCEVLEIDPPRRLRWAWRGGRLDTVVTWTLAPEGRAPGSSSSTPASTRTTRCSAGRSPCSTAAGAATSGVGSRRR
ncbi:SRPBCC domain-containing protein [Micromonospora sp. ATA51]|uniref:SRPBCC family protein n=1 Tax=Micromonospora sp. ATA51 TaxID=2806098 RepID=UPI001A4A8247|nr:SRPBCC domain-containing protein [Micromonospora sp. ATA51]MBM0229124.1 SRPBCC domain-containing protein [Micromonospora sp. ATA51]